MTFTGIPRVKWSLASVAACILLAAFLLACGGDSDAATSEKVLELQAQIHSLEETVEALEEENGRLSNDLTALGQRHDEYRHQQKEAADAKERELREESEHESGQEGQLASLEEGQAETGERLDDLESSLLEVEKVASQVDLFLPSFKKWIDGMERRLELLEGSVTERTARLAEEAGGEVYYIGHPERNEPAVLVMPLEPIEGNPLIVSLHGYGGNSADHALYVPLHGRVVQDGFGLLLPNGISDADGQRFWNPTEGLAKARQDDFAYLSHLVAEAQMLKDFGPVYIFGYSNGGFMAYYMACKGLPGLRAVASLAGTSYVDDSACEGAPPVSVLHIHGSEDPVIRYLGEVTEQSAQAEGRPASYASAKEMVRRWGRRAGCQWPDDLQPSARLDLDEGIAGPETRVFRPDSGCAEGIDVQLWMSGGSRHSPDYGDAFMDALIDWLLSQQ